MSLSSLDLENQRFMIRNNKQHKHRTDSVKVLYKRLVLQEIVLRGLPIPITE